MSETINSKNMLIFSEYYNRGKYTCTICHKEVELEDSYSNKGHNLICVKCVSEEALKRNKSRLEYVMKYLKGSENNG